MNTSASSFPLFRLLFGSLCISFSPVFIKVAAVDPDLAGFYRMLFAVVGLLVLLLLRRELPRVPGKILWLLAACGIALGSDFMCWHRSIELIGPGLATLLGNFQVFFTAFFSWLVLKERISGLFIVAVVLGVTGLFLITGVDAIVLSSDIRLGLLLGVFTALAYSTYIMLMKKAVTGNSLSGVSVMLWISLFCMTYLGAICLSKGTSFAVTETSSLLALAGVGILGSTIGWSLLSSALKIVPASIAGLVMLLQPALSFIWDILLFKRPTGWLDYVGVLMILTAIYLGTLRHQTK